jgi:heat shock protein HtpX
MVPPTPAIGFNDEKDLHYRFVYEIAGLYKFYCDRARRFSCGDSQPWETGAIARRGSAVRTVEGVSRMNRMRTVMLLATLAALCLWVGQMLAGRLGLAAALIFVGLMNLGAYWFSDLIILRMYRAQELSETNAADLLALVRNLAFRVNLPMPRVYLIPEEAPNAFATGRNPKHAAVAVTAGLLRLLKREELEAVFAHEIGHIKNRDTLIMTVAASIAGALSMAANMAMWGLALGRGQPSNHSGGGPHPALGIVGVIMAPIAALIIQLAISRSREFMADAASSQMMGNPLALARALQKLEIQSQRRPLVAASPATAHLFIVNPFSARGVGRLFSTHPPVAARVARLQALARGEAVSFGKA